MRFVIAAVLAAALVGNAAALETHPFTHTFRYILEPTLGFAGSAPGGSLETTGSSTHTIPQFDPIYGTLTGIHLSVNVDGGSTVLVQGPGSGGGATLIRIRLFSDGEEIGGNSVSDNGFRGFGAEWEMGEIPLGGHILDMTPAGSVTVDVTDFARWFAADNLEWLVTLQYFGGGMVPGVPLTTLVEGSLYDVTYFFIAPEPGTVALVGLGIMLLGARARRS